MTDTMTEDQSAAFAAASADDGKATSNRKKNGKRRLSKRERKNLKKQKTSAAAAANTTTSKTTAAAGSSSAAEKQNNDSQTPKKAQPTLAEYHANYNPALPVKIVKEHTDPKSLGKWFPKASVVKSKVSYGNDYLAKLAKEKKKLQQNENGSKSSSKNSSTDIKEPKASLVLFYQYVNPTWSNAKVSSFLTYLTNIAQTHRTNIGGRIRVSTEGINATVSAASTGNNDIDAEFEAAQTLRHFTKDLQNFDQEAFVDTDFKFIDGLTADRHFKELKLLPVKELVFYGIREDDCATSTSNTAAASAADGDVDESGKKEVKGGVHLDATDYHEMLKRNDAVVIDVRNHYEAAIGRFDGQMATSTEATGEEGKGGGGATYIDPKMRKSTDFTSWLAEETTKEKLEGKTVMMFCTGGIRCERASAYLNSQMGNKVKGVFQLKGGIERYLKEFPDGGFWRGKNFVFDKREAISAGNVNGDGGVIRGGKKKNGKNDEEEKLLEWGAECAKCKKPWDRYIGKRKCYTCGVPVLVCDDCMSQSSSTKKKKKGKGSAAAAAPTASTAAAEDMKRIRCPLCVSEGVTVPAEDVEWTDNGVRGRLRTSSFSEGGDEGNDKKDSADGASKQNESKAAKSVLKWGGGHAKKKKDQRNWSRRPCQFGVDCVRKDCFFYHPEREPKK